MAFALHAAAAALAVPCALEEQYFQVKGDPQWYRSIAIRPLMPGDKPSPNAVPWLQKYVKTIKNEAQYRGYLNANTRPHYEWEWDQLEQCRWPVALITESGKSEILGGVSYAIRWQIDDLLPFQRRFRIPLQFLATMENRAIHLPDRWVSEDFREQPRSLFSMLPAVLQPRVMGEGIEVKHLYIAGKHTLQFLAQLHRHSADTDLFRFSRIATSALRTKPSFDPWSYHVGLPVHKNLIADGQFRDYIQFAYFDSTEQPFVRASKIFLHVSDTQFESPDGPTQLAKLYQSILGFPSQSMMTFLERPEWGTEGVLTEIFEMTDDDYLHRIQQRIEARLARRKGREVVYASPAKCPKLLMGAFEREVTHWIEEDLRLSEDPPHVFLESPFQLTEEQVEAAVLDPGFIPRY